MDMNRNYFKKELAILKFFGTSLYGNEGPLYRIYSVTILFITLSYPVVAFAEAFKHEFDTASYIITYVFSTSTAAVGVIVMLLNGKKVLNLLQSLGKEPYLPNRERGGDVEERMIKRCVFITTVQSIASWISICLTVGGITVFTLKKRIESSDYHDWEFNYGPITVLNITYSPNYEITWLYQIVSCYSAGFNYATVDLIMAGILAHICVQFQMLQNNLERIIQNAFRLMIKDRQNSNVLNDTENCEDINAGMIPWKYLKQSLDSTVRYHLKILELVSEMEDIFNVVLFVEFVFSLGIMCLLVYSQSLLAITDILFLKTCTDALAAFLPILLLSYWSEEVGSQCFKTSTVAAQVNFAGADVRFQKSLTMIIQRSQRNVRLKAGKLINISLPTFVWILRTSYSVFMVLRKMNEN